MMPSLNLDMLTPQKHILKIQAQQTQTNLKKIDNIILPNFKSNIQNKKL